MLGPDSENWKVVPLGYVDNDLFLRTFVGKICRQLLAKKPGVRPYDAVLAGVIAWVPMEDMDLVISPKNQRIEVNPDSPNFAQATVK